MTSLASVSSSVQPTHLPAVSGAKGAKSSGLGTGSSTSASGDTTTVTVDPNGSLVTTVTNAQGQIVSIATTQATAGPLSNASNAGQALGNTSLSQLAGSQLNKYA